MTAGLAPHSVKGGGLYLNPIKALIVGTVADYIVGLLFSFQGNRAMPTGRRVHLQFCSSSSVIIPNEVPSAVACGLHESGNKLGFHNATVNAGAGEIAAAEGESGRQRHKKKREDGTPKKKQLKKWEESCNETSIYKEKNGHCNISQTEGDLV